MTGNYPTENPATTALIELQTAWPAWEVWTVHQVVGGTVWCARLRADHKTVVNADSPGHLAEMIGNVVTS